MSGEKEKVSKNWLFLGEVFVARIFWEKEIEKLRFKPHFNEEEEFKEGNLINADMQTYMIYALLLTYILLRPIKYTPRQGCSHGISNWRTQL